LLDSLPLGLRIVRQHFFQVLLNCVLLSSTQCYLCQTRLCCVCKGITFSTTQTS